MRRALFALGAAAITMAVLLPGAFGRTQATPGVTATSITIGGTFPLSGPASSYAPIPVGMEAYFSYVNATQGPGRQARRLRPADRLEVLRRRVQPRQHRAAERSSSWSRITSSRSIGALGTEPQLAVRDYLNQQKVPQVYVSTGASDVRRRQSRSTRGRSAGSLTTRRKARSTASTSPRTSRTRRSASSTRTTTTARTTSRASRPGSARSKSLIVTRPATRSTDTEPPVADLELRRRAPTR